MTSRAQDIRRTALYAAGYIAVAPEPDEAYGQCNLGPAFCYISPTVAELQAVRMLINLTLGEKNPDRPRTSRRVTQVVPYGGDFLAIFVNMN
jgi:hypothetical protein